MERLSAVMLTKNEEKDIRNALENIKWADEIIIIDDYSTDSTVDICKEYTSKIFQNKLTSFSEQRTFGLSKAGSEWILVVDADDLISSALQREIQEILKNGTDCHGFMVFRTSSYLGRWIKNCGWRAPMLLLFRKAKARYDGKLVHEKIVVDGKIGFLKNEVYHISYKNLSENFLRMDLYTTFSAEDLWNKGLRLNAVNFPVYFIIKPIFVFFRKYFVYGGIKEGARGLFICVVTAFIVFMNYAKLWEKQKNQKDV